MVSTLKCILAVSVLASVATFAFAIECYQCESASNAKCGVDFEKDDAFKFDCTRAAPPRFLQAFLPVQNATGCMKVTLDGVGNRPHIVRACYFGDPKTKSGCQSDPTAPFIKQLSCEVCTDRLCNGSSATGPIAIAVVLFFALARMLA